MENEMRDIVAEDGRVIGTAEHLQLLYYLAREKEELNRNYFQPCNYKWKIGVKILSELEVKCCTFAKANRDTKPMIFDIEVEIDYVNPENVQLWKNITNEL